MSARDRLRDARRIVVKVGTSTLTHPSGGMNLHRIEHLVRELIDEANQGKEVLLVSSGAIAAGMNTLGLKERPAGVPERQALAAIGQGALLHIYEKFFHEYGRTMAQVLLTKENAMRSRSATMTICPRSLRRSSMQMRSLFSPISTGSIQRIRGRMQRPV